MKPKNKFGFFSTIFILIVGLIALVAQALNNEIEALPFLGVLILILVPAGILIGKSIKK